MNRYIFIGLLFFVLGACTVNTTEFYGGPRYLSFINKGGADTAFVSFANYPGVLTHEVPFVLALTGDMADQDCRYELEVVDSLTTAGPMDYKLPDQLIFRKNRTTDTLLVSVSSTNSVLEEHALQVTFRIVANENFQPGLAGQQKIKVTFTNMKSRPDWWQGDLQKFILGTYSAKKMEHFIISTGVNSLEGVELSVARAYTLRFKRYCIDNGITEEDNVTPMANGIPCY